LVQFIKLKPIFWQHKVMNQTSQPSPNLKTSQRKIRVRKSGVHGKGVFALVDIPKGEVIIEYVGEIISAQEAEDRHPHDPSDPNHTFYFQINDDKVLDALHGGNSSRWINHSCAPNCAPKVTKDRVFIKAKKNITAGEELNYDYGLVIDAPITKKLKLQYPCWCGSDQCRGTLLAHQEPSTKKKKQLEKLKIKLKKIKLEIKKLKKR
jgi:SET domain-containing protein